MFFISVSVGLSLPQGTFGTLNKFILPGFMEQAATSIPCQAVLSGQMHQRMPVGFYKEKITAL